MIALERWLTELWYEPNRKPPGWLRGLSKIYDLGRRRNERVRRASAVRLDVPVIVVGNITAGGTGKTPFVLWLAQWLRTMGFSPGIVSSGYRGSLAGKGALVTPHHRSDQVGDEAALMAAREIAPVAIGADRARAAQSLVEQRSCDIVVSDDGLQHYQLHRDIEVAIVDAKRGYGNGFLIPAGPLREPVGRLEAVELVIEHGNDDARYSMQLIGEQVVSLFDERVLAPSRVHAVAGIGNPERFFQGLQDLGFEVEPHAFPDHHRFRWADVDFGDEQPVVMTEKDAVKCRSFPAQANLWYLPVQASLSDSVKETLSSLVSPWRPD